MHDGDRGICGRPLLREQQRERAAECRATTEDAHRPPGNRHLVEGQQCLDTRGCARDRSRHRQRKPAHVQRVEPVDVLVRIHLEQRRLEVDLRRRRVLDQHRVDIAGVVEIADGSHQIVLRRKLLFESEEVLVVLLVRPDQIVAARVEFQIANRNENAQHNQNHLRIDKPATLPQHDPRQFREQPSEE